MVEVKLILIILLLLIDPFFAILAGIFGFIIWYNQKRTQVIEELPKRMTVHFVRDRDLIASCYESALAHEGDIRQMAQQIGKQMLGGDLKMYPYFNIETPEVCYSETEKKDDKPIKIRLYKVTIFLNADKAEDILMHGKTYTGKRTFIWSENNPSNPNNEILECTKEVFLNSGQIKSLTEIRTSNDFELVYSYNIEVEIESLINESLELNKKIKDFSDCGDDFVVSYLKDSKVKVSEKLKEKLAQKAEKEKKKK